MQTKLIFYSLYSVVTLKIRSRSSKSTQILARIHHSDRMQTSCFWTKFDIQSAGVTFENNVNVINI